MCTQDNIEKVIANFPWVDPVRQVVIPFVLSVFFLGLLSWQCPSCNPSSNAAPLLQRGVLCSVVTRLTEWVQKKRKRRAGENSPAPWAATRLTMWLSVIPCCPDLPICPLGNLSGSGPQTHGEREVHPVHTGPHPALFMGVQTTPVFGTSSLPSAEVVPLDVWGLNSATWSNLLPIYVIPCTPHSSASALHVGLEYKHPFIPSNWRIVLSWHFWVILLLGSDVPSQERRQL